METTNRSAPDLGAERTAPPYRLGVEYSVIRAARDRTAIRLNWPWLPMHWSGNMIRRYDERAERPWRRLAWTFEKLLTQRPEVERTASEIAKLEAARDECLARIEAGPAPADWEAVKRAWRGW